MSREFPKIETLFNRDKATFRVTDELRDPAFGQLKTWVVTEKIDGTNIRISLEPSPVTGIDGNGQWSVRFGGRTDDAQIPTFLLEYLQDTFTLERMEKFWRDGEVRCPVTLYGEGYGARIQKGGGNYREGVSFRLFDVLVSDKYWLDWRNVVDVAARLGITWVPCLGTQTIEQIVRLITDIGLDSAVAFEENKGAEVRAEGVVARSEPYLYTKEGAPLRFKLKASDFQAGKK